MKEHQLNAILFSDIVGYSSQMAADEATTLDVLQRNRLRHQRIVTQYQGRIVDTIGDGHLCLFSSSLDAVHAGLALQQDLHASQDETRLRVGIHVGDTVVERDGLRGIRVIGDAVNTASRIESNAPSPGVWVSARVATDLRSHAQLTFESAGMFALKNLPEPMELFQVQLASGSVPAASPRARFSYRHQRFSRASVLALGTFLVVSLAGAFVASQVFDEPEYLAVLPLEYVGADAESQYLATALSTRLQSHLAPLENIKLASQSNARRLTDASGYLGEEEVDFFIEGSLLLVDQQVTIEISVVEADADAILFSEQWQGPLDQLERLETSVLNTLGDYVAGSL
ncbi:adenylate/guanylate cyclase domain-containing protein [Saccharospirillum impatiens]|uniref:adenylate/guanylate cyclase domain-containing protein n=1 Tax=Saccharospirillum impatiens TaxID=169438 RepID=UPI0004039C5B|nr:adenylate/guanylate cyclase domain-containing protein [Saccharospirillum impatiens]